MTSNGVAGAEGSNHAVKVLPYWVPSQDAWKAVCMCGIDFWAESKYVLTKRLHRHQEREAMMPKPLTVRFSENADLESEAWDD